MTGSTRLEEVGEYVYQPTRVLQSVADFVDEVRLGKVSFFFFSSRRRHTRCSRAWSSDVCSSDLGAHQLAGPGTGRGQPVSPPSSSPSPTVTSSPGPVLPPAGSGPLILGLDASNRIVMTRIGSTAAPVPVPGLPNIAGGPLQIATNPAGGWVVTYSTNPRAPYGEQPA